MANINSDALSILRNAQNKTFDAAANGEVAGTQSLLGAKQSNFKATEKQAKGEQISSLTKFAGTGAGLGLNFKTSMTASDLMAKKNDANAVSRGTAMNSVAQNGGFSDLTQKGVEAADQQIGGAAMSSAGKVAGKEADLQETMATSQRDTAKGAKDAAIKAGDSINEFAKGLFQRAQEVISKAF